MIIYLVQLILNISYQKLKIKIDKHIEKTEKYYIDILDGKLVNYLLKDEPTDTIVVKTSDHFLKFRDIKFPINKIIFHGREQNIHERKFNIYHLTMIYMTVV